MLFYDFCLVIVAVVYFLLGFFVVFLLIIEHEKVQAYIHDTDT